MNSTPTTTHTATVGSVEVTVTVTALPDGRGYILRVDENGEDTGTRYTAPSDAARDELIAIILGA